METSNAIVVSRKKGAKKRGGLNALWAAVLLQFKIRASKKAPLAAPNEKKKEITTESSSDKSETTWKNIVGGIRPLHLLQPLEYRSSSASLPPLPPPPPFPFGNEIYHDVSLPPPSSPSCNSCDGMSSRYCSVEDLHALDTDCAVEEEGGGSDVINTQADEFIAKFYEQIRLQRIQSLNESNPGIEDGDC